MKILKNSFELLKLLENSVEVLKILENKLKSMKILENKLESLKLQENQPVDRLSVFDLLVVVRIIFAFMVKRNFLEGVFGGSIWWEYRATGGIGRNFGSRSHVGVGSFSFFDKIKPKRYEIAEKHRKEEDQEGNNSPEIETLPLFPIHGGSHHDFFGVKASNLSSDHSVPRGWSGLT
ncbi:hypothetical protein Tco_0401057 [Tanacetum coccineum]